MKHLIKWIPFILVLALIHSQALAAGTTRIGVVDIQDFQKNSKAFQKTRDALKAKAEAIQHKIQKEQKALQEMEDNYKKQSLMLSLDAKEDKKQELDKKRRYFKYVYEDLSLQMKDLERDATRQIVKELEKVVKKIAEEERFTIILEKRTIGLIYYDDAIDVTKRVTELYDKMKQ